MSGTLNDDIVIISRTGTAFDGTFAIFGVTANTFKYDAIETDGTYLDGLEVCDLTVDCNVDGQASPHVACGAVVLRGGGKHFRVRRVRAINFGSRGRTDLPALENFVFFLGAANAPGSGATEDTHDVVFEECIAEWPSPNVTTNSTLFHMCGSDGDSVDARPTYHRSCAIRNCYVNTEHDYGPRVRIASLNIGTLGYASATGLLPVTTTVPHGKTLPGNVLVQGLTYWGVLRINYRLRPGGAFGVRGQAKRDPAFEHVDTGPPARKRRRRSALPAHSISFAFRASS
jgi:hypothetical protein